MLEIIVVTIVESYYTDEEQSMRIQIMFVILVITGNFITYVSGAFIKSRTWHEEFVTYRRGQQIKILYPRYKLCRAPREKPEKIKQQSVQANVKTAEVTWAELLTVYSADSGSEIYSWDFWKRKPDKNKATRLDQFLAILKFLASIILIFMVFVFLVPTVGRCGFKFYSLIWLVIFHPEMRRICRRIFITKEKLSRRHMRLLLPKTGDRGQQRRKQIRLPFILREYNEEEVPAELQISEEEDSDGEISSDGFENLLVKNKNRGGVAKNLVSLMATTEAELESETDNVFLTTADDSNRTEFVRNIRSRSISASKH